MSPKTIVIDNKEVKDLLKELRRRVDITYKVRIIASDRLRGANDVNKKQNIYFSILVTIASVLSISSNSNFISALVLAMSIIINYYMLYCSEKNLQERAYKMEETYKKLDRLKNKIDIIINLEINNLSKDEVSKLYKEYENIIDSIENHKDVDYYKYILENTKENNIVNDFSNCNEEDKTKMITIKRYSLYVLSTMIFIYIIASL